jgi:hypothetical protein
MIDLSFTVSEAEFLESGIKLATRTRGKFLRVTRWASLGGVWICGLTLLHLDQSVFGAALIGFAILLPLARWFGLRRVLSRNYRGAPFMHSQIWARIDEAGITMTYQTGSSVSTWDGYQACFETKDLIVLQLSTTFVRVFPKRAFSTEQLLEFRQLLEDHKLSPRN